MYIVLLFALPLLYSTLSFYAARSFAVSSQRADPPPPPSSAHLTFPHSPCLSLYPQLNIKAKSWYDLLTSEKFARKDIITIQVRFL